MGQDKLGKRSPSIRPSPDYALILSIFYGVVNTRARFIHFMNILIAEEIGRIMGSESANFCTKPAVCQCAVGCRRFALGALRHTQRSDAKTGIPLSARRLKRLPPHPGNGTENAGLARQAGIAARLGSRLDPSALLVVLGIYRTFAVLDRDQSDELGEVGLTPMQCNILTTLQRTQHPVTAGELAQRLVVLPNNLSRIINELVERGLVRRKPNKDDKRSLFIVLTPQGKRLLARFLPIHWERLGRILRGVSREDRIRLAALLKALVVSIAHEREDEQRRTLPRRQSGSRGSTVKTPWQPSLRNIEIGVRSAIR